MDKIHNNEFTPHIDSKNSEPIKSIISSHNQRRKDHRFDSNKQRLFEDRGLQNQRSIQTRGKMHSTILKKEQFNKSIPCEAIHCNSIATEKILLSAGKFGTIDLFVCDRCVRIFKGGK